MLFKSQFYSTLIAVPLFERLPRICNRRHTGSFSHFINIDPGFFFFSQFDTGFSVVQEYLCIADKTPRYCLIVVLCIIFRIDVFAEVVTGITPIPILNGTFTCIFTVHNIYSICTGIPDFPLTCLHLIVWIYTLSIVWTNSPWCLIVKYGSIKPRISIFIGFGSHLWVGPIKLFAGNHFKIIDQIAKWSICSPSMVAIW